jgi:hypothetical protein
MRRGLSNLLLPLLGKEGKLPASRSVNLTWLIGRGALFRDRIEGA